jgi:hypothetical protein
MIRAAGVLMDRFNMDRFNMDRFNMDQFNDAPLSPWDEHPVCPTCGGVLAHLLTVSSDSVPQMGFFFEFSVFHCVADGLFYRTRPSSEGRKNDSGVRAPCKRPPTLNEAAATVPEPEPQQLPWFEPRTPATWSHNRRFHQHEPRS